MPYHFLEELTEEECKSELLGILARGNHKLAIKNADKVSELLEKDVRFGFFLLIPTKTVPQVRHAQAQP